MRLASYNVENLFERAKILNRDEWVTLGNGENRMDPARQVLNSFSQLNSLLAQQNYSTSDKTKIAALLSELGLGASDESQFVILKRNRGSLVKRSGGVVTITANGRDDWIGWVELKPEAVKEKATKNTARIINRVNADIMVVIEAEHRPSLLRFNDQVLHQTAGWSFDHVALFDGNDERGIDVGIMCKAPYSIDFVRTHVDDKVGNKRVFSRDCPEYHFDIGNGRKLIVLANHLKSKGYGKPAESDATRLRQATRVREIYDGLRASGNQYIAIVGDFNDNPSSAPLAPLLEAASGLRDVSAIPGFDDGGRPGTYGNCTASQKIDYILLSPELFQAATGGGVDRSGIWGGVNGTLFPHIAEIEKPSDAASDHAAIYVDINL